MIEEKTTRAEYERRAELWAEALESGEYVQGKGYLCAGDKHCCLGVACDLYSKLTGQGRWEKGWFHLDGYANNREPQREVADYFGLRTPGGVFHREDGRGCSLTELNDGVFKHESGANYTFSDIANVIRSRPQALFTWKDQNDG